MQGTSVALKLGSTISLARPIHIKLPHGNALSPTSFNVVMAGNVPSLLRDSCISATIYADDVCVGSSGAVVKPIQRRLQAALDRLSDALCNVGLTVVLFYTFPRNGTAAVSRCLCQSSTNLFPGLVNIVYSAL